MNLRVCIKGVDLHERTNSVQIGTTYSSCCVRLIVITKMNYYYYYHSVSVLMFFTILCTPRVWSMASIDIRNTYDDNNLEKYFLESSSRSAYDDVYNTQVESPGTSMRELCTLDFQTRGNPNPKCCMDNLCWSASSLIEWDDTIENERFFDDIYQDYDVKTCRDLKKIKKPATEDSYLIMCCSHKRCWELKMNI